MKIILNYKQYIKKEKGAISTLVLFTVLLFAAILMGSYLVVTGLQKSQLKSDIRIQDIYLKQINNIDEIYEQKLASSIETLRDSGIYVSKETIVKDAKGNQIIIPKGFKIAEDSGLTVDEGIVIEDKDIKTGIGNDKGNQYVWVPVGEVTKKDGTTTNIKLGRYTFESDGKATIVQKASEYLEDKVISNYYRELADKGSITKIGKIALNLKNFLDSAQANKGYYIARYEASYGEDGKANFKVSNGYSESTAPTTEGTLWNYITEINSAKACREMYDTITSDLANSYAWDTAIFFIQECSDDPDYSKKSSANKTIANTGEIKDEVCKINDMASNNFEWTTEYSTEAINNTYALPSVYRGGCYKFAARYPDSRYSDYTTCNNWYTGFRAILYIE